MIPSGNISMFNWNNCGLGQKDTLLVTDIQGNVAEKYVYDPAGNILSKTIDGKTTTFTYDKANQLVSSTCDGKVTKYQYDAAGRLIKESDKSYEYGWLDKVLAVRENGKKIASFDYQVDGQISQAVHGGKVENFLWDELALIHRGETSFVNEPYVTGGNPILSSKQGVMFNDMLGNTLGTKQEKFNPVQMTAFGETKDPDVLFTGKPYIGELGYAFLFRNYRADKGKWLSADPLGYPDGWNNLAYVNNGVTDYVDNLGGYSLDAKLTALFVYRVFCNANLSGSLSNWIWTSFDFEDENKQLASVIETAIKNHIGVISEGTTGVLQTNIASYTETKTISYHEGLAGFFLSSCSNVSVDIKYKRIHNQIVIQGSYRWQDTVDGNSFPGIAYLKGEEKNVYDNGGNWLSRILQTIEGFEDLFLETGLAHVQFNVNISGTFRGVIE